MNIAEMKINGSPLRVFGAELLTYNTNTCEMDKRYFQPISSIIPVVLDGKIGLRRIELTIDFSGNTKHEIEKNISNFTSTLINKTEIFLPDGYYYTVIIDSIKRKGEKAPWIEQMFFTVCGFRHGPIEKTFLSSNKIIFINGNQTTPAIIKIVPRGSTTVTINDITINNISGEIVIDGIEMTVKENGLNKFADTVLTDFPKFKPGNNDIALIGDADVEISYYPIYF